MSKFIKVHNVSDEEIRINLDHVLVYSELPKSCDPCKSVIDWSTSAEDCLYVRETVEELDAKVRA